MAMEIQPWSEFRYMSQQVPEHRLCPALCRERSVYCLCCTARAGLSLSTGDAEVSKQGNRPGGYFLSCHALLHGVNAGVMTLMIKTSSAHGGAYLPWLSMQDRALDGKSPLTAVPVPWSLHSAVVPLSCLHTCFFAKSRQLICSLLPHGVLHTLCCVQWAGSSVSSHQNPHWRAATVDTRLRSQLQALPGFDRGRTILA